MKAKNFQLFSMLFNNCLNKHVHRSKHCWLLPFKKTKLIFAKNSRIDLDGNLSLNSNCIKSNGHSTVIRLDENSVLKTEKHFSVYYGGDIIVFQNGKLTLGGGFCNSDVKIRCTKQIEIGYDVAISHNVTIMDSDAHEILTNGYQKTMPVKIGNHVWIGTHATILKGVSIGDGAVIAANSVVTKDIPSHCLAAGVPAHIIKQDVSWK